MDSGLAYAALRASRAPGNDGSGFIARYSGLAQERIPE